MKKSFLFLTLLITILFYSCNKTNQTNKNQIIVYSYSSFLGEWGAGPKIAELFTQKTGIEVVFIECDDGNQVLSKAILEKDSPYADILLGLDNNSSLRAYQNDVLETFVPSNASLIDLEFWQKLNQFTTIKNEEELKDANIILTPFDFSHFTFIFNTNFNLPIPKNLEDLTKQVYKKKIILLDGQTSTPGIGFKEWVNLVYKEKAEDYLARLNQSVLTVAPSWSSGYGMFTNQEAPMVLSYTTSPPYHIEYGEGDNYKALVFEDGHIMQVEGLGLVKGAKNKEKAKLFIEFMLSIDAQNIIPLTQWMFPVNKKVSLPKSFEYAPIPNKILN